MPAAAVIPAPIAYIKVVAVKKLVVGFLVCSTDPVLTGCVPVSTFHLSGELLYSSLGGGWDPDLLL